MRMNNIGMGVRRMDEEDERVWKMERQGEVTLGASLYTFPLSHRLNRLHTDLPSFGVPWQVNKRWETKLITKLIKTSN